MLTVFNANETSEKFYFIPNLKIILQAKTILH